MFRTARPRTLALCLALAPLALASAQTEPPTETTFVFTTVEAIDIQADLYEIAITGILQGEGTPRTISFPYYTYHGEPESPRTFERCERMALLAMNKPGRYLFEIRREGSYSAGPRIGCKLTRVP